MIISLAFFIINIYKAKILCSKGLQILLGNREGENKMGKTCIAVDIGASSGRVIAGTLENNKISIKEVHRFKNNMVNIGEHYYWNIDAIFDEIIDGLKKLSSKGVVPESIGIDTWGVDYALLDIKNMRVSPVFAYRDHRTDMTMEEILRWVSAKKIYEKTGIQFQQFNTIYQLFEHAKAHSEIIGKSDTFLMVPDYLNYLLSGVKAVEFTNATTTQLFNANIRDWDADLVELTGMNRRIFPKVVDAGTVLGSITEEVQEETNLPAVKVIAPATHDTGSAVVSVPAVSKDFAYISSGTWSLMGIESKNAVCTEKAREYNFTNEGGAFGTYRVLKNIMGLWMIQEVQRLYNNKYSFAELIVLAEQSEPFKCLINPNHSRFLNPSDMIEEIKTFCGETGQHIPETPGEIARCIFESLAFQYREVLQQLRDMQNQEINRIHIIGGGAQNKFLNQLTASFTGCEVYAGPIEATAIGNLAVQFIALGELESLDRAREMILESFEVERYSPKPDSKIEESWCKFKSLV
jgi:rhamnulokinase